MIRAPRPCRVVFDGQSRVNLHGYAPTPDHWDGVPAGTWTVDFFGLPLPIGTLTAADWCWPRLAMAGRGLPAFPVSVDGRSLTWLADNWSGRADVYITPAEPTIYVLCGGYSDYGSGDSGAQVYADAGHLADLARAAGAAWVICTTTLPSVNITGPAETERQAGNALILADAAGHFDATVDFEVPGLDDPTDTASYIDGTHLYAAGSRLAAAVATPVLDAAIAAVAT